MHTDQCAYINELLLALTLPWRWRPCRHIPEFDWRT